MKIVNVNNVFNWFTLCEAVGPRGMECIGVGANETNQANYSFAGKGGVNF